MTKIIKKMVKYQVAKLYKEVEAMRRKILAVVGALGLMAAGSYVNAAPPNGVVTINATLLTSCSFTVPASTITATLDPAQGDVTAQGVPPLAITCTGNTNYTINADNGLHYDGQNRRVFNAVANEYIPYQFDWNPKSGSAQALIPITVNTQATFRVVDFQGKPGGLYTDIVTLTVNP